MARGRVALVSMPWVSAWMPSIQLSILRQCAPDDVEVDTFELFVDYAATISPPLYRILSEAGGMIEEWVFAKNYFEAEGTSLPDGFLDEMPEFDVNGREKQKNIVEALVPVTHDFLQRKADEIDWGAYDVIAFSLSIYQTAPSMALARLIKRKHKHVKILFGGNSCVGPSGRAIMKICPYVDYVAQGEAELSFGQIVDCAIAGKLPADVGSTLYRDHAGAIVRTEHAGLAQPHRKAAPPNFDAFFERFQAYGIYEPDKIWLPFESSRGCWWGETSHCTFCGLHEIMKYRARNHREVLEELDYLYSRYEIGRFFATDLIMPMEYYGEFLDELAKPEREYIFFYELKGNVKRDYIRKLRDAGVTRVQPGLESLSSDVLKLMHKGLTVAQGVEFLRWCQEYGVNAGWNVIVGMPREKREWNVASAALAQKLVHLQPPHFIQFELNRYSPIWEKPEEHGLSSLSPLYIYKYIFPVEDDVLFDLVYRFEYDTEDFAGRPPWLGGSEENYAEELREAINEWRASYAAGAHLVAQRSGDGGLKIIDGRDPENLQTHILPSDVANLFRMLDRREGRKSFLDTVAREHQELVARIGGIERVECWLDLWMVEGLIMVDGEVILALPTFADDGALEWSAGQGPTDAELDPMSAFQFGAEVVTRSDITASSRDIQRLTLGDGTEIFAKQLNGIGGGWEGKACVLLADLARQKGRGSPAPQYLGEHPDHGSCFEALSNRGNWTQAILNGDGMALDTVAAVAIELAAIHALTPPFGSVEFEVLANQGPDLSQRIRLYDTVTVVDFSHRPGVNYADFLATAQSASAPLRTLREQWKPEVLIHGDFKPDNILLCDSATGCLPIKVVDWELCGLGERAFDLGTALGGLAANWLSSVRNTEATSVVELLSSSASRSTYLALSADTLLATYCLQAEIRDDTLFRSKAWSFAGLFLLELGYVANATQGRMTLTNILQSQLGAKLLVDPLVLERALSLDFALGEQQRDWG